MTVTRFAPSPTGYLHIGGLRTALFNWLWARNRRGKFLLRIEDTDLSRNSDEATKAIIEAFNWLGLEIDGEITYQSKRFDVYQKYIAKLLDEDKAYYCYMTKEELDELRQSQQKNNQTPRYDGRYRDKTLKIPKDVKPVVRIKAPQTGEITIKDGIKGDVKFNWKDATDDFIIARADGSPTYNFVVAIDDALMGVTDVIRGDDHLSNTPKQIAIYKALDLKIPKFFHVPMIHNENGKKLSKRDGAMDVMEYKNKGYLPEALLNFLVRLGWSNKDQEIFSLDEMKELFNPNNINKSASKYNLEKLLWLNSHYIKDSQNSRLEKLLIGKGVDFDKIIKKNRLLDLIKDKAKTLVDLRDAALKFTTSPSFDERVLKVVDDSSFELLDKFLADLKAAKDLSIPADYKKQIDSFLKEHNLSMPSLGKPIRLAFFGEPRGPSLDECLSYFGIEETSKKIKKLKDFYKKLKDKS